MVKNNQDVERYLTVRQAHSPCWSPDGRQIAFIADSSGLDQVWTVQLDSAALEEKTAFSERVGSVAWSPDGQYLLITLDAGGNEHDQLYLISLQGGSPRALTDEPAVIHNFGAWSPDSQYICYSCNRRNAAFFDVWVMNVATGESRCVWEQDATLGAIAWSADGALLLVERANTNLDNDLFLVPLHGAAPVLLTTHQGESLYQSPRFSPDGKTLYVLTNYEREFLTPAALALSTTSGQHASVRWLAEYSWDTASLALSHDGRLLAWAVNHDGCSRLVFYDVMSGKELPSPQIPLGVAGSIAWSPDDRQIAFSFNGTRYSGNIWLAAVGDERARQLTTLSSGLIEPAELIEPSLVRYPSFDGLEIPAYYYRPLSSSRARDGKLPVIVFVHGGPESQFRPLHAAPSMPPLQYWLQLGFAVFAPNVRGSLGYGKSYVHLDDVHLRPNSVADLKAGVEWLMRSGEIDPQRIGIMGRSYGGFMVLAAITTYPELWAAAVDMVGIANFLTFFENTGVWRRHLRAVEYGDPERDADFLRSISPLFHVDRITTPLLVLHGENDPRVPVGEAKQIVDAVKARGVPTELMLFPDEGHFMLRLSTQLKAYTAMGTWFERHMG
jgi:dipeptidyl aminopeptidase/acylaminoacyl peptidase